MQLVSVVLDSEFMWNDSIALLDYGFPRVQPVDVLHKGDIVKTVDVISGKKSSLELKADALIRIPVVEGEHSKFKTVVEAPNQVSASIHQGDPVGRVKVMYEDREVAAANLVAAESIEKKSFFSLLRQKLFFTMNYLKSTLA